VRTWAVPESTVATKSRPEGLLVIGLVMLLVGGGRWASYLHVGPLFVSDIVLGLGLAGYFLQPYVPSRGRVPARLRLLVSALLIWVVFRLLTSDLGLTRDGLRDAAPYGYIVACIPGCAAARSPRLRALTGRIILTTLIFHTVWVGASLLFKGLPLSFPSFGGGVHVFELRADYDAVICGVTAVMAARKALTSDRALTYGVFAVGNLTLVLLMQSRSGLLATLAVAVVMGWPRGNVRRGKGALFFLLLVAVAPFLLQLASPSPTLGRLLATVGGSSSNSTYAASANGTKQARLEAWKATAHFVVRQPLAAEIGVGPGEDYLADSGAATFLEGTDYTGVRSPHNYWLGTWARLGVPGLVLMVMCVSTGLRLARKWGKSGHSVFDADELAPCLLVGLPIAASVGVILESPFGAVTYFWALGWTWSVYAAKRIG
jgi:hypothetical protein